MNTPTIAVIVAARDAQATMRKCLDSLLTLDYPGYEVIVVDDGSKDDTPRILEEYREKIKVITLKGNGPSAARNIASRQTQAEYVAFTDSDCVADRLWLKELIKGFQDSAVAGVGGSQRIPEDETRFGRDVFGFMKKSRFFIDYMGKNRDSLMSVRHNPSYNVMYRRDVFVKAGGFLEGLWPGEDVELDYRLTKQGHILKWNPKAFVFHYKPQTLSAFMKMMYRYGDAQGRLVRRYGIFRKVQMLPLVGFFLAVLFAAGLWLNWPLALASAFLSLAGLFVYFSGNPWLGLSGIVAWHSGYVKGITSREISFH